LLNQHGEVADAMQRRTFILGGASPGNIPFCWKPAPTI
jgi:hypothetical protein